MPQVMVNCLPRREPAKTVSAVERIGRAGHRFDRDGLDPARESVVTKTWT